MGKIHGSDDQLSLQADASNLNATPGRKLPQTLAKIRETENHPQRRVGVAGVDGCCFAPLAIRSPRESHARWLAAL